MTSSSASLPDERYLLAVTLAEIQGDPTDAQYAAWDRVRGLALDAGDGKLARASTAGSAPSLTLRSFRDGRHSCGLGAHKPDGGP